MKKKIAAAALVLCAVLAAGGIGHRIHAAKEEPLPETAVTEESAPRETPEETVSGRTVPEGTDEEKTDTVYVLAGADGTAEKTFGEGELPLSVRVRYELDGREMDAKDLAGKSGHLKIRFEYTDLPEETVTTDGTVRTVPVPVPVVSGVMLDHKTASNVTVSSGRVLDDGSRYVAAGLAVPGLKGALALEEGTSEAADEFRRLEEKWPESVEIEADVTDLHLDMTLTAAMPDLLLEMRGEDGERDTIEAGKLKDTADELRGAMRQLSDGSGRLEDGLALLEEKSGELADGAKQLSDGAGQAKKGAEQLAAGTESAKKGARELSGGLDTLSGNSAALREGAAQVFDGLLRQAREQIISSGLSCPEMTPGSYSQVLNGLLEALDETKVYQQALEAVTKEAEAHRGQIREAVAAAVRAEIEQKVRDEVLRQVRAQVLAAMGLNEEAYEAAGEEVRAAVDRAVEEQMTSESVRQMIDQTTGQKMEDPSVQALIDQNTDTQIRKAVSEAMAGEEVQSRLRAASAGAQALIGLKASLDSYNAFYLGLCGYTDGVDRAAAGARALTAGMEQLQAGADRLKDGTASLSEGTDRLAAAVPALSEGTGKLHEGSSALSEGIKELNEKGITRIASLLSEELPDLISRAETVRKAAEQYSERTGAHKVIYRTGAIGE